MGLTPLLGKQFFCEAVILTLKFKMKKAIFLDRDWTINVETWYTHKISDLKILDWAKEWLKELKENWFLLIIITNQSGIWRWYYNLKDCEKFNKELEKKIQIKFDAIYICPHKKEDNCKCRKPWIFNLIEAQKKFDIDFKKSYFLWDKESDILIWRKVWCKTVFIKNNNYKTNIEPDYKCDNILEFSNEITNRISENWKISFNELNYKSLPHFVGTPFEKGRNKM